MTGQQDLYQDQIWSCCSYNNEGEISVTNPIDSTSSVKMLHRGKEYDMKKVKWNRYIPLYLMMLPGLAYLIVNNYMPMPGLILAFKKYNYGLGIWKSPFNHFENFGFLLKSPEIKTILRNTILYNLVFIVLGNIMAVAVATLLSFVSSKFMRKLYQTIYLIPYLISIVIVSYMVFGFLSTDRGLINHMIMNTGGTAVSWYTTPKYWPLILTVVNLWKGFGYTSIIYFTTILGIDPSLNEAARIDGASNWKVFQYVTLPSLKITIITMVMLNIGRIFYSDFGLFYQVPMNSGPLLNITSTLDTYVYRALLTLNDLGRSAVTGFLQSVCGFILIVVTNALVKRIDEESSLF